MRLPSRLSSTICGAPFNGVLGCLGCAALRTIPPRCTDPVFRGGNGSETSYCKNSPVPKQETYRKRSSRERLMTVITAGADLKALVSRGLGGRKTALRVTCVQVVHAPHFQRLRRHRTS